MYWVVVKNYRGDRGTAFHGPYLDVQNAISFCNEKIRELLLNIVENYMKKQYFQLVYVIDDETKNDSYKMQHIHLNNIMSKRVRVTPDI